MFTDKWTSVEERLPNEEENVLVLVRNIEHYGRQKIPGQKSGENITKEQLIMHLAAL